MTPRSAGGIGRVAVTGARGRLGSALVEALGAGRAVGWSRPEFDLDALDPRGLFERDRPSLVVQTPAILLLVPGSLGYLSLTSFLDRDALAGIEGAFRTGLVAISLVGGLLAANVVLPPRRVL